MPLPAAGQRIGSRLALTLGGFGAAAILVCALAPLVGSTSISLAAVFDRSQPYAENIDAQIFFVARLPRVLGAALVGSALGLAGVIFQALLRNPLASPDTLGVSAGASLGAMLAITFGVGSEVSGVSAVSVSAFIGSLGALLIVYSLSLAQRNGASTMVLLLGGVTITALLSAVMTFIQYVADFTQTFRNVRWMMGSLDVASYAPLVGALIPMALAWAGCVSLPRALNLMSVSAESAAWRGVDVVRTERIALVSASLATGAAVSLAGPVAFVGIIVPHVVRLVVGPDHRLVLPGSALFGATLLVLCDLVARTIAGPTELPVGIVTAMVGGPVFLWLLLKRS